MKVRLAIAVAALQVCLLAFMAGQREWISRFGDQLTLRTAPIDPNDPMRGAYVRLNYEINWVPAALCKDGPAEWTKVNDYTLVRRLRDRVVYALLRIDAYGIAELVSLSDVRPSEGTYLRGRVESVSPGSVQVRYGIEALFMEKAQAVAVEHAATYEKVGAPMNVHVAASSSGIGVLRDFEWEPLGITIEFDPVPPREAEQGQPDVQPSLTGLTVNLHNYSDADLAIVDLPDDHSFRLLPNNRWMQSHYAWSGEGKTFKLPALRPDTIVILKPGATHKIHIDLTKERWWIVDTNKPGGEAFPMQQVQDGWSASFRIEYAPPGRDALAGLPNAELVRHAPLRSRAFNANRGID
ncbi:MAG TPA: GDYXXLXY domain-containing protein [Opitutaceae bacterium]|nr:GDYXXLXY domain-containing protein [Opitutaceae bacterium]